MEYTFLPLDHQGGTVTPKLKDGKVIVTIKGREHAYTVAKTSRLKSCPPDATFNPQDYCLLYTPTYVCVVNIDDKNKGFIEAANKLKRISDAKTAWMSVLELEKRRFVEKGYHELLIPLPRKVGQTNKCYLVEGPEGSTVAMSKKEYNALCRANTAIKAHFNTVKQRYEATTSSNAQ